MGGERSGQYLKVSSGLVAAFVWDVLLLAPWPKPRVPMISVAAVRTGGGNCAYPLEAGCYNIRKAQKQWAKEAQLPRSRRTKMLSQIRLATKMMPGPS